MEDFEILKHLVSINTINDKNNKEFINYVKSLLERKEFLTEVLTNSDGNSCLIAKNTEDVNLCFMGHSDTVTYSDGWKTDPFVLTQEGEYLYGLGACDMKGGIAAFIDALNQTDIDVLNKGIMVIITYDEEIGFKGIKFIKDRKDIPNNIIIGEPTDLEVIAFCKGCMEYKVTLHGKAVHSSLMPKGDNAILKAYEFVKELNVLFEELKVDKNDKFDIPYTTMNIAMINGGKSINIVPDKCELTFDFRTIHESHHKIINDRLNKLCEKYKADIEVITDVLPSNNNSKENIEIIESILNKKTTGVNYVTEGNFLENKNIFIIGPGPVSAHEIDEHISIESYNKTVESYKGIIKSLCK